MEKMPTYTCEKCARTFSQKSHYTSHQNKKIDCSTKTAIKKIAQKIVDKEKEEEELKDKKEFNIEDFKLFETAHYFPRDQSLFVLMATLNESFDGVINKMYDNNICNTDDIIILEEGVELIYIYCLNIIRFTHNDIKYFPVCLYRNCNSKFFINCKENYRPKSITLNSNGFKKLRNMTIPINKHLKDIMTECYPYLHSFSIDKFILEEIPNIVDNPYELLLSQYPDTDGIIHILDEKQYLSVSKDMNDIIILEEGVEVNLIDRNENCICLSGVDLKYLPLYALHNTRVNIIFPNNDNNDKKDIKVITFNYDTSSKLISNFIQNSIKFENGVAIRLNK
jgi:hypothetical protein